jgi:hypothetical protein
VQLLAVGGHVVDQPDDGVGVEQVGALLADVGAELVADGRGRSARRVKPRAVRTRERLSCGPYTKMPSYGVTIIAEAPPARGADPPERARRLRHAGVGRWPDDLLRGVSMTDDRQKPTGRVILNVPMRPNDAGADTIRGYLVALLAAVWDQGEEFNGKRPFGYSDWQWDLWEALARAGHVSGTFDEGGHLDDVDRRKGRELIASAIRALGDDATT